jgi:phosphoheptose isomerase
MLRFSAMGVEVLEAAYAAHLQAFARLKGLLPAIAAAGRVLAACLRDGGKVLLCGNGGSAADAQHLAAELVGCFSGLRRALPAVALTTDPSVVTALANDFGYEHVFARQIEALGRPGDVLVAISTSGQSANTIRALEVARLGGLGTVALLGRDGGAMRPLADLALVVDEQDTARIQEAHVFVVHALCAVVEAALAAGAAPAAAEAT